MYDSRQRKSRVRKQLSEAFKLLSPAELDLAVTCIPFSKDRLKVFEQLLKDIDAWTNNDEQPIMWIHGKTKLSMSLLAQAIANKLNGRDQLSASYFHPNSTKDRHDDHVHKGGSFVIPTLAYQLAQKVPETKAAMAQSIMRDDKIFNSEALSVTQLERLITGPLKDASKDLDVKGDIPRRIFLVYGLDDSESPIGKNFLATLLQAMAAALPPTQDGNFPHKFLIIGDSKQEMMKWVSSEKVKRLVTKVHVDDLFPTSRSSSMSHQPGLVLDAAFSVFLWVLSGLAI